MAALATFNVNVIPVDATHVVLTDPQGKVEPFLCSLTTPRVFLQGFINFTLAQLQNINDAGAVTWEPGVWTITLEKTAGLASFIQQLEVVNATQVNVSASVGVASTGTNPAAGA